MTVARRLLVAAIDQGTTSSRCILFDRAGQVVSSHQLEHRQITPRPGWIEHDAEEILERVRTCLSVVLREAFSGLFAPHWRADARGIIAGLTAYATRGHIARAALEATAYQVYDLCEAMAADLGASLPGDLRVGRRWRRCNAPVTPRRSD